jgi:hypothetical protein
MLHSDSTVSVASICSSGVDLAIDRSRVCFEDKSDDFPQTAAISIHFAESTLLAAVSTAGDIVWYNIWPSDDSKSGNFRLVRNGDTVDGKFRRVETLTPRLGPIAASAFGCSTGSAISSRRSPGRLFANLLTVDAFTSQLFIMESQDCLRSITSRINEGHDGALTSAILIAKRSRISISLVHKYQFLVLKRSMICSSTTFPRGSDEDVASLLQALQAEEQNSAEMDSMIADLPVSNPSRNDSGNWKHLLESLKNVDDDEHWVLRQVLLYVDSNLLRWLEVIELGLQITETFVADAVDIIAGLGIELSKSDLSQMFCAADGSQPRSTPIEIDNLLPKRLLLMMRLRLHFRDIQSRLVFALYLQETVLSVKQSSRQEMTTVDTDDDDNDSSVDLSNILLTTSATRSYAGLDTQNGLVQPGRSILLESKECTLFINCLVDIWKQSIIESMEQTSQMPENVISMEGPRIHAVVLCPLRDLSSCLCQLGYVSQFECLINLFPLQLAPILLDLLEEMQAHFDVDRFKRFVPFGILLDSDPSLEHFSDNLLSDKVVDAMTSLSAGSRSVCMAMLACLQWICGEQVPIFSMEPVVCNISGHYSLSTLVECFHEQSLGLTLGIVSIQRMPDSGAICVWHIKRALALDTVGMFQQAAWFMKAARASCTRNSQKSVEAVLLSELNSSYGSFAISLQHGLLDSTIAFSEWLYMNQDERIQTIVQNMCNVSSESIATLVADKVCPLFSDDDPVLSAEETKRQLVEFCMKYGAHDSNEWMVGCIREWSGSMAASPAKTATKGVFDDKFSWQSALAFHFSQCCQQQQQQQQQQQHVNSHSLVSSSKCLPALEACVAVAEASKPTLPAASRVLSDLKSLLWLVVLSCLTYNHTSSGLSFMWSLVETTPTTLPSTDKEYEFLSLALNELQIALEVCEMLKERLPELPQLSLLLPTSVYEQLLVPNLQYLTAVSRSPKPSDIIAAANSRGLQSLSYIKQTITGIGFLFEALDVTEETIASSTSEITSKQTKGTARVHKHLSLDALCNRVNLHEAIVLKMTSWLCEQARSHSIASEHQSPEPVDSRREVALKETIKMLESVTELCTSHFDDIKPHFVARIVLICVIHYEMLDVLSEICKAACLFEIERQESKISMRLVVGDVNDSTISDGNASEGEFPSFDGDNETEETAGNIGEYLVIMGLRVQDILVQILHKSRELINSASSLYDEELDNARSLLETLQQSHPVVISTSRNNNSVSILGVSATTSVANKLCIEFDKLKLLTYLSSVGVELVPVQLSMMSLEQLLSAVLRGNNDIGPVLHCGDYEDNESQKAHGKDKPKFKFLAGKLAAKLYASAKYTAKAATKLAVDASARALNHHQSENSNLDIYGQLTEVILQDHNAKTRDVRYALLFHYESIVESPLPGQQLLSSLSNIYGHSMSVRVRILSALMTACATSSSKTGPDPLRAYRICCEIMGFHAQHLVEEDIDFVIQQMELLVGLFDQRSVEADSCALDALCSAVRAEMCCRMWLWCPSQKLFGMTQFWKCLNPTVSDHSGSSPVWGSWSSFESNFSSAAVNLLHSRYPHQHDLSQGVLVNPDGLSSHIEAAREIIRAHLSDLMCPSSHLRCLGIEQIPVQALLTSANASNRLNDALCYLCSARNSLPLTASGIESSDPGNQLFDSLVFDLERKLEMSVSKRSKAAAQVAVNEAFVSKLVEKGYSRYVQY